MRRLYLIFIGYVYTQSNTKHPHDIDDNVRNHAANRIINMSYELVIEAKLLQRQIQPIQAFYEGQITYEIGYVMGKIRERYKRMIEIYKQAHYMTKHLYLDENNITQLNKTLALKPGIKMYYPINWVINMEYMRLFEVDIDKLVEVLENIPSYALSTVDLGADSNGLKAPAPKPEDVPPGVPTDGSVPKLPPINVPANAGGPPTGGGPGPPISRTGYPPGGEGILRDGPPSQSYEPLGQASELTGQPNELLPGQPNELLPGQSYEPSPVPSQSYDAPPSFPHAALPGLLNEPLPDPERHSYEARRETYEPPLGQINEPPPDQPNEPPPGQPNEPLPGQAYELPQGQPNEPPPGQPYEPPPGQPNEPLPGQAYELPQGQPNEPPPGQPYEPPPGQPNEPPPGQPYELPPGHSNEPQTGPTTWPIEPPAGPYGKIMRFGSADTSFRTEEELKQYYREMYREKHNGMNDKYDYLY